MLLDAGALRLRLRELEARLQPELRRALKQGLHGQPAAGPFGPTEYTLSFLLSHGAVSWQEYEQLRDAFAGGNRHLYDMDARRFGEVWAQSHVRELDQRFARPSREADPGYCGQYDLWLPGIRTEVKASRAATKEKGKPLTERALLIASTDSWLMNFQHLKPASCHAFVFVGVWLDQFRYWVLSSETVAVHPRFSQQTRTANEGQLTMTGENMWSFAPYLCPPDQLVDRLLELGAAQAA